MIFVLLKGYYIVILEKKSSICSLKKKKGDLSVSW